MTISTSILKPEETDSGVYVVVIEGWHIRAIDKDHAERIIDACKMVAAATRERVKAEIRVALGLRAS
ncbi:MAG: hypothetical protein ACPGGK_13000 [Pikeienuella sp.]